MKIIGKRTNYAPKLELHFFRNVTNPHRFGRRVYQCPPRPQFAVLEQLNGCVFDPQNEHTHRGFAKMGFPNRASAQKWAEAHSKDVEFINGAGGISSEHHYIVVKSSDDGWIKA